MKFCEKQWWRLLRQWWCFYFVNKIKAMDIIETLISKKVLQRKWNRLDRIWTADENLHIFKK